ncbi:unnamed protein product [Parajaminaea phylloscopi]
MALPAVLIPAIAALAIIGIVAVLFSSLFVFTFILASIVLVLTICISVLITLPFTGSIVRLRANYLPKAVSLDNVLEDGAGEGPAPQAGSGTTRKISAYLLSQRRQGAKIGPVVSGVFPMLARTKKLEGWQGIYKGSFFVTVQLLLLAAVIAIFFDVDGTPSVTGGAYKSAPTGPGQFGFFGNLLFMCFVALISLPLNVATYRTIVHPRVLSWRPGFAADSLAEILSPAERAQPWRLYLIPGLLAATFAHIGWVGLLTRAVRHILVPTLGGLAAPRPASPDQTDYTGPNSSSKEVNPLALVIFLVWCLLSVVALSPLEVVTIRLAVQRPVRQQPLHLAYSRVATEPSRGPASYSHQASAPTSSQQTASFSDNAKPTSDDKPLPSEPSKADDQTHLEAGRPSFAIDDEDEIDAGSRGASGGDDPAVNDSQNVRGQPARTTDTAGGHPSGPLPQPNGTSSHAYGNRGAANPASYNEPSEPVIALRPVEEVGPDGANEDGAGVVERYEGLKDCIDKLVEEEGVEALYRGAWVTALGALGGSLGA